ncbi:hypothetical protein [Magnetospirillum sp. 64-120]|uniref:tetratricopeptide repeat protein n=1 Tax=Magnetospirillum sp. 64-120 TaxID=1895778 RepID=UPI0009261019|nr:hypothetical protein [Magnetospirillum sp. 64-120]OJX70347.1 MAG: hypothetical protein BGO92_17300 [Magnetospirillum sp. 64-120]
MTATIAFSTRTGLATALALLFRDGPAAAQALAARLLQADPTCHEAAVMLDLASQPCLDGRVAERAAVLAQSLGFSFLGDACGMRMAQAAQDGADDMSHWQAAAQRLGFVSDELERAERAYEAGDWEQAAGLYDYVWRHRPRLRQVWLRRLDCAFRLGDLTQTMGLCQQMGRADFDNQDVWLYWGFALSSAGDMATALEVLDACDQPRNHEVAAARAIECHVIAGDPMAARMLLPRIALPLRQAQSAIVVDLAEGRLPEAEKGLDVLDGTGAGVFILRGVLAEIRGQGELACQLYRQAVELGPKSFAPLIHLADCCRDKGDTVAADQWLARACAVHAGDVPFRRSLRTALLGCARA